MAVAFSLLGWAAVLTIAAAVVNLLFNPIARWRLRKIPGPPAMPFFGHLIPIMRLGTPTFFRQCIQKYGPVFKVSFGRQWVVVVADPELLRQAGSKLLNHQVFRGMLRGELAELDLSGLVSARDDLWRRVRAAWQPAFSPACLSGYLPGMVETAQKLVARLEARAQQQQGDKGAGGGGGAGEAKGQRVDVWRELGSMTLQVVGSTAYGVDFHAMDDQSVVYSDQPPTATGAAKDEDKYGRGGQPQQPYGRRLVECVRDVFKYSTIMNGSKYSRVGMLLPELRPLLSPLAHALPDKPFAALLQARTVLYESALELIRGWKPAAAPSADANRPNSTNGHHANGDAAAAAAAAAAADSPAAPGVAAGSFLDLMLSSRDKASGLTDPQVVAQVQTFLLAGYETTASSLAFAIYCIATNPEVESKLLAEIDSVLGRDRAPTETDLPLLPYTEAVFNEALRMYPPAHGTNRQVEKVPFTIGGYTVPPKTPIFMSIFGVHNSEDVWPRAAEFIPERFLPSSPLHAVVCARVPHAHVPFGVGSRMCIGWKFALQEAKVALALLYQRLTFELEPGQVPLRLATGITITPKDGLWVRPVLRP